MQINQMVRCDVDNKLGDSLKPKAYISRFNPTGPIKIIADGKWIFLDHMMIYRQNVYNSSRSTHVESK